MKLTNKQKSKLVKSLSRMHLVPKGKVQRSKKLYTRKRKLKLNPSNDGFFYALNSLINKYLIFFFPEKRKQIIY